MTSADDQAKRTIMPSRKLIRPDLRDFKERMSQRPGRARTPPPEQTNAEAFYYTKQMTARSPMVVVLVGGEVLHGIIEWYDRECVKINRTEGPNVLVPKHSIKYMYKEGDGVSGE